ncbi:uncharacterized protein EV422DRAFT_178656 [Fimicolochytrium jonesii]|uniref:uncharacterized protein n=1 Tax=Fimicolochytrium jonesii TaxID=1396493 RepID=UPI0022FF06BB|nr:uncharacterized protein EV422DRAFT_178656 [Fimicolochytrium jonesii]KAI8818303.1 hypothetical protein EV422DRAFT_178656 [Fimicolochytrium jonesii]
MVFALGRDKSPQPGEVIPGKATAFIVPGGGHFAVCTRGVVKARKSKPDVPAPPRTSKHPCLCSGNTMVLHRLGTTMQSQDMTELERTCGHKQCKLIGLPATEIAIATDEIAMTNGPTDSDSDTRQQSRRDSKKPKATRGMVAKRVLLGGGSGARGRMVFANMGGGSTDSAV